MSNAPDSPGPFLFSADPAAYRAEGAFVVRTGALGS